VNVYDEAFKAAKLPKLMEPKMIKGGIAYAGGPMPGAGD